MDKNILLPDGIIYLEYSEKQRMFHFADSENEYYTKDWIKLKAMSIDDAIKFTQFIDKKYVENRNSGIIPEFKIIKLELELFFELKNLNRKLSGR